MHKSMHNSYYEATIQIRPFNQQVLEYVVQEVAKRKDVFISKTKELKTGIDIFLSSQRFARTLGKKLKERFKGALTISKQINRLDRQTGVILYRATVLFRLK
ncbi:MAG TPA: NMD3-related protein [Candidatus Nanoarchaeia archaeon]|nr:NMD3-related protein [Candidatus Nanoarchaeia archaeon]